MTEFTGSEGRGTLFKINPDSGGFIELHLLQGGAADVSCLIGSLVSFGGVVCGMTSEGKPAGSRAMTDPGV
jgi:hypothetical protein